MVEAVVSGGSSTMCAILENLSTTMSSEVPSCELVGKSVIKSIARCYQGYSGTGKGISSP